MLLSTRLQLVTEDPDGVPLAEPLEIELRELMPGEAWSLHAHIARAEADIDELLKAGTAAEGPDRAALYASAQQHADELRAHIVGVMLIPTPPIQVEYGGEYGRAVLAHLRDVGTSRRWSPSDLGAAYTACKTMIARRQLAGYGVDHVRVTRLIDYLRSPEGASDRRMSQVSQVLTGDPAAWLSDDPDGPWLRLPESTRAIAVALAVIDGR